MRLADALVKAKESMRDSVIVREGTGYKVVPLVKDAQFIVLRGDYMPIPTNGSAKENLKELVRKAIFGVKINAGRKIKRRSIGG